MFTSSAALTQGGSVDADERKRQFVVDVTSVTYVPCVVDVTSVMYVVCVVGVVSVTVT